jgi:hypothetical protein
VVHAKPNTKGDLLGLKERDRGMRQMRVLGMLCIWLIECSLQNDSIMSADACIRADMPWPDDMLLMQHTE